MTVAMYAVQVPPGWVTRAFFALADNHGVLLRGLQRDDENLEDLFSPGSGGERTQWAVASNIIGPGAETSFPPLGASGR